MKTLCSIFMILICLTSVSLAYPNNGYEIGDKATDFSLKNVDGNFVSMSDYEDANGYVVIFTCNTCPWAQKYEDRINALHEKLTPKGFPVIAINPNDPAVSSGDSFEQMKLRAAEKGFEFPYLFDAGQVVFPQYGATRTPHVFVLDKNLVVKYIGAIDDNPQSASSVEVKYVENAVMAVQAGEMPDPGVTKAIGCGIKVKA